MSESKVVRELIRIVKRWDRYISGQRQEIVELKCIADKEEKMKATMKFDRNDIRQLKGR